MDGNQTRKTIDTDFIGKFTNNCITITITANETPINELHLNQCSKTF